MKNCGYTFEEAQGALDEAWEIMNPTTETNMERLKIIKGTPHYFTCDVLRNDFLWLFRQAERAQELQFQLNEIKIIKYKNGRPTVLDWNGERWVLDSQTTFKGGVKHGKTIKT